jgi:AcrR family transcriptional regulator
MILNVNTVNPIERRSPVVPRRERLRAATEAEIVDTARQLLVEGGPSTLALREVGRRMGMTASALYRYVDGHDALVDRLAASFFEELTDVLQAELATPGPGPARHDRQDDDAVAAALLTASRAFRRWSVAHPAEFGLMYGGGVHQLEAGCPRTEAAGERFGAVFLGLLLDGLGADPSSPHDAEAPDGHDGPAPGRSVFEVLPGSLGEQFARAWVRLLGLVMVEVVGRLGHTGADPERIFELEMADCARGLVAALREQQGRPGRSTT